MGLSLAYVRWFRVVRERRFAYLELTFDFVPKIGSWLYSHPQTAISGDYDKDPSKREFTRDLATTTVG